MKSKVANRKRKELRKLTWLLCTFPDSAECPFLHGGRRDSWLPRENTRECDPAGAWKTRRQHASRWLQDGPEEMNHCPKVGTGQFTLSWRVANVTGLRCSAGSHQSAPPICLTWTGIGGGEKICPRAHQLPAFGSRDPHHDQKWNNASLTAPYLRTNPVSVLPQNWLDT